jgi:hypothetical protein
MSNFSHFRTFLEQQYEPLRDGSSIRSTPNAKAVENSKIFLAALEARDCSPARLALSAEGGVAFLFFGTTGRYASLECLNDGTMIGGISDRKAVPEVWEFSLEDASIDDTVRRVKAFIS